jgi:hypothetical protein
VIRKFTVVAASMVAGFVLWGVAVLVLVLIHG